MINSNPLHIAACDFADTVLSELADATLRQHECEYIWDLAYDAFLYRSIPGTLAVQGGINGGSLTPAAPIPGGKL